MFRTWLAALAVVSVGVARADDTSASDKLRILYSTRFTFTEDGLPLITVEIMSGRDRIDLRATGGIVVRPDGVGGSSVDNDGDRWTITVENAKPSLIQDWTIVETFGPDDADGVAASLARWKSRGLEPRAFDVGTLFGTSGEVIDTRETRIGVDPVANGKGTARAAALAKKYRIKTFVHEELVRRPTGTIVARSGATTIKNPSVLWFQPKRTTDTILVADVPTGTGGSQLQTGTQDRRYWGSVYITLDHRGLLVAANAVSEAKLLAGIVPSEMLPSAPMAALEAQAIAARTELLQKIGRRNLTDPFLLCSTQQCQVYGGAGKEHPRTTRAIEATRGMVLLRNGGGMVDVRYSASCGGHTEDNDAIWGGEPDPALRGRTDDAKGQTSRITADNLDAFLADRGQTAWCSKAKASQGKFRWTERITDTDLTARVAIDYPQVGRIKTLIPKARGASGRIGVITIGGDKAQVDVTGDLHIRRLLGGLKSSLFDVKREGQTFVFRGAGFGHGVGMCQLGAMGMAEAGKTRDQILAHYYRGTHIHKLY